jgi:transposase
MARVAAEMEISRACAPKWVNRWCKYGDVGLLDRASTPRHQPTATPSDTVGQIEVFRREHKWSASRIAFEINRTDPRSATAPSLGPLPGSG